MVTVDTSFKELKSLISKDLTVEKLDKLLFDMGMELDSNQGDALRIDVTPDRPDMVSLYGLARAIRAYNSSKKGMPSLSVFLLTACIRIWHGHRICQKSLA